VRIGLTWFDNRIHDLIATDPVTFATYANVGRARTQGLESFIDYRPLPQLTLRLDYTYTEATDEQTNQELLRRPKNRGTFDATWQLSRAWQATLDVLSVGSWADGNRDFSKMVQAPGYTVVNLASSYQVTERLGVLARIDNLFDRHYENPVGFLQPSISAYAGINFKL
jgi:vitamin B12 transporter